MRLATEAVSFGCGRRSAGARQERTEIPGGPLANGSSATRDRCTTSRCGPRGVLVATGNDSVAKANRSGGVDGVPQHVQAVVQQSWASPAGACGELGISMCVAPDDGDLSSPIGIAMSA